MLQQRDKIKIGSLYKAQGTYCSMLFYKISKTKVFCLIAAYKANKGMNDVASVDWLGLESDLVRRAKEINA